MEGVETQSPRVAVVGCGYWGKNLVRNFRELGALARVVDPSEAGRALAQELAPEARVGADFGEAIADPGIDAVVLATPAETHAPLAGEAMRAGKDVFVEKPLALDHSEGEEMARISTEEGRVLMVGHLLEYHPAVITLRELIAAGELGDLRYAYSNRLNFGKVRTEENALWSFAPHDVAVLLRLLGEAPSEVSCVGMPCLDTPVADVTVSNLAFPSGKRAHIFVSWLNPFKEQKLVVVGSRKMAVFNDVEPDEKLTLYDQRVAFEDAAPVLHKGEREVVAIDRAEPLRLECQHFLDRIRDRRTPLTDAASGVEVLRVLQACQTSLEQGGLRVEP